jgi:hypothetical protein
MMNYEKKCRREFWEMAVCAALPVSLENFGDGQAAVEAAAIMADVVLVQWEQRFKFEPAEIATSQTAETKEHTD